MDIKKTFIASVFIILVLVIIGILIANSPKAQAKKEARESFAMCIKDSGAIFYGAFWCPHCQTQKAMFKQSAKTLPYVECSTADGQNMTQECKDLGIKSYPTWFYPNETVGNGEQTFEQLSLNTSCPIPEEIK